MTFERILQLPEVQQGRPEVLAGRASIGNLVRWVHVSELPDVAGLLQGAEVVLTTGIALPESRAGLTAYVDSLAGAQVAGLVIELGRHFEAIPEVMVTTAERWGLPLVACSAEVRFVDITEAIHRLILEEHVTELRTDALIHETFTDLALAGASTDEIVQQLARMADSSAVLENMAHQVLGHHSPRQGIDHVLEGWEDRSRSRPTTLRTELVDGAESWLITQLTEQGHTWGRLVLVADSPAVHRHRKLLEQAAVSLILNRRIERDRNALMRDAQGSLLHQILNGTLSLRAMRARAEALGVTMRDRVLVGVVLLLPRQPDLADVDREATQRELSELAAEAADEADTPALIGQLESGMIGLLVSLPDDGARTGRLEALARGVHRRSVANIRRMDVTAAAGSTVRDATDIQRSFAEARQVAMAAIGSPDDKVLYELSDVRIRGLVNLMRDDPRLQTFLERELGPILHHDETHGTNLGHVLHVFVSTGGNKSEAATVLGLSRPALYQRLATVNDLLDTAVEDPEVRTSLHVALLALEAQRNLGSYDLE